MKAINNGKFIIVEADFLEMATIVQVLNDYVALHKDDFVKGLVEQLHNPEVVSFNN